MRLDPHLAARPANLQPLTPLEFLVRSLHAHPDRPAVLWRNRRWTYRGFAVMVARFAARLSAEGVGPGDVVSVMATNRPEMLAAHYAVPMLGAVLNTINIRLDRDTIGYILGHSESRLLLCDPGCCDVGRAAAAEKDVGFLQFACGEPVPADTEALDILTDDSITRPLEASTITDEWQPLCLNYRSGTTGHPKGVVYHHRGAYPDGDIEIKDRSKDIIISGGENISSLEVESMLHQHPAVRIAAVVGIPDPKWGEAPCAFVEIRQGTSASAEELREFCRARLAGFKTPRCFVFCDLPKTATGKIQKFALRDQARLLAITDDSERTA